MTVSDTTNMLNDASVADLEIYGGVNSPKGKNALRNYRIVQKTVEPSTMGVNCGGLREL